MEEKLVDISGFSIIEYRLLMRAKGASVQRTILELFDISTEKTVAASRFLDCPEAEVFALRRDLRERLKRFKAGDDDARYLVCPECYQPLYISGHPSGAFFFKHGIETGDCPNKTTHQYTPEQILAMRYNGAKESPRHYELKHHIASALARDPRISDIAVEQTYKSRNGLSKEWKKPDVAATFEGKRIVFEIQLSTTFQDVIIGREEFYRREGVFILWVFDNFTDRGKLFTEKDIYYTNKRNAFVISNGSREATEEQGCLILSCKYHKPFFMKNGDVRSAWDEALVDLADLTYSTGNHKVFYHDYDKAVQSLYEENESSIRKEFEHFWLSQYDEGGGGEQWNDEAEKWWRTFKNKGFVPPGNSYYDCMPYKVGRLIDVMFSLKHRHIYFYKYENWIQVMHQIAQNYPEFTESLIFGVRSFGMMQAVLNEDRKESFRKKLTKIKELSDAGEKSFIQNREFNDLFEYLFPELKTYRELRADREKVSVHE